MLQKRACNGGNAVKSRIEEAVLLVFVLLLSFLIHLDKTTLHREIKSGFLLTFNPTFP